MALLCSALHSTNDAFDDSARDGRIWRSVQAPPPPTCFRRRRKQFGHRRRKSSSTYQAGLACACVRASDCSWRSS